MNYSFALVGNPNVGKTSLYNRLTRSSQHVGNWHGVTVDKVSKKADFSSNDIEIVDLPGLYSLTVYSYEEEISRDEILRQKNDLIIYVCDANNIARNLYLALQLIELGKRVMIVVNMIDELDKRGLALDTQKMQNYLHLPVKAVSAKYGFDQSELLLAGVEYSATPTKLPYLDELPIQKVKNIISENIVTSGLRPLYACIKVLEKDQFVIDKLNLSSSQKEKLQNLGDYQATIAKLRYQYIDQITKDVVVSRGSKIKKIRGFFADNLDKLLLNKFFALPIFLLIMSGIFWVTFGFVGKFTTQILENGKDLLILWIDKELAKISFSPWITALITRGIIDGVGGVVVFLPQIVLLFFFLALLEDSGYVSRVAFMTDGLFNKIGLSGRAVFTMIMGLGCSASAVLTARGLEDELMRKKTVILTPFISCSARLPVYTAIAAAFFGPSNFLVVFALYLLGIAIVVLLAAIFERTSLKSGQSSFVMEMPKYRLPTAERVLQIIGNNAKVFIVKVGTVVFAFNVIVWVLSNFSLTGGYIQMGQGESIMERIGALIAPVFKPLGFGNWQAVTALISGMVAKEAVLSTITTFGGAQNVFVDSLAAFCFLVYTLLYVPCFATLGAIKKEAGLKWMFFGLGLQLVVAYVVTLGLRLVIVAFSGGALSGIFSLSVAAIVITSVAIICSYINKDRRCVRCNGDCNSCG